MYDQIPDNSILFADESRGINIPLFFITSFDQYKNDLVNVDRDDLNTIANGPDDEYYWDAWQSILDNATVIDHDGNEYTMFQDGDLWLIPVNAEWQ